MQNKIAFFGTPEFAVSLLDELERGGVVPSLIVTNPDTPKGRKLIVTPPPVKTWGLRRNIKILQPENFRHNNDPSLLEKIIKELSGFDIFIVAAYGKIIPELIINLPKYGTINIHPSLLPKYRGPAPVQAAILNGDKETGISIMLLDREVDHGPVIAQEKIDLSENLYLPELKDKLAKIAGRLIIKILPSWIRGDLNSVEQNHDQATFTKKIQKEDGFIESAYILDENISLADASRIERMVRALNPDPGVFTYFQTNNKKIRVKITRARVDDSKLVIEKVISEGKKEARWEDFKRGNLL